MDEKFAGDGERKQTYGEVRNIELCSITDDLLFVEKKGVRARHYLMNERSTLDLFFFGTLTEEAK
jgi:hypothetical protein